MKNVTENILVIIKTHWQRGIFFLFNISLFFLLLAVMLYQTDVVISILNKKLILEKKAITSTRLSDISETNKVSIAKWHLFGKNENHPPTNINNKWIVEGIILGDDTEHNMAIIGAPGLKELIYHVGDILSDGTVISQIASDRVFLTHNGITEAVSISWDTDNSNMSSISSNTPTKVGKPFTIMKDP